MFLNIFTKNEGLYETRPSFYEENSFETFLLWCEPSDCLVNIEVIGFKETNQANIC